MSIPRLVGSQTGRGLAGMIDLAGLEASAFVVQDAQPSRHFVMFGMPAVPPPDLPLEDGDLELIEAGVYRPLASLAWSANCPYYFVFEPSGIVLLNTLSGKGWRCKRRSARFLTMFLDAPIRCSSPRSRHATSV